MQEETESIRWKVEKAAAWLSSHEQNRFREELSLFVFFHLGSDACIEVRDSDSGLFFSFRHDRIEPFEFELSRDQVRESLEFPDRLETRLLDYLTRHRRS